MFGRIAVHNLLTSSCALPTLADMPTPKFLSAAEAAEALGVDRSTISRWVERGRLAPDHKLPGRRGAYLFSRAAIEAARPTDEATQ